MKSASAKPASVHPAMVDTYKREWLHPDAVYAPMLRYNMAHLIAAAEKGVVPQAAAAALVKEMAVLVAGGPDQIPQDMELDGLQPNIEAELSRRLGAEIGGWLNTGRARQECEFVARQIANRDRLGPLIGEVTGLCAVLLDLADQERETVMPYATWAQHAEPITFGYYAAALAEGVIADLVRLRAAYQGLSRCRADIGQVVPPPLSIDRQRVAGLLGFETIMGNSLYAYASLDSEMQVLSVLAILMGGLARASENLFVWSSPEYGFLRFGKAFSGTSYLMPQKRNPYALRMVRPVAAQMVGAWNDSIQLFTGGLPLVGNGLIHISNRLMESLDAAAQVVHLLALALPSLELDRPRMRRLAQNHWAQAPQLVYLLVCEHTLSFRIAHHAVAKVVNYAVAAGINPSALDASIVEGAVQEVTGRKIRIPQESVSQALDASHVVDSRGDSGPAPEAVAIHVARMRNSLAELTDWLGSERGRIAAAGCRLKAAAEQLTSG